MAVETRSADADRRAYLVDADAVEAALGEQARRLLQDLLAAGGAEACVLMDLILDSGVSGR
ncbi:hypothetical protein SAZ11_37230 [Streptomyces sp. FXJ1.4098]|nr:hypothetical protein [Streptomyces sp. FXJ1.4098]